MNKSINSIDNYKQTLIETNDIVIDKYLDIIHEYIMFAISNIHIQKHNYFKYIINKGLETIQYVFLMLLLYTKNLELVHYHCSKAFYYYVEFIGQVGDDNHVFLRLTSKDAILFVYKKTIFEINDSFKRTFQNPDNEEKKQFDTINSMIELTNSLLYSSFDKCVDVNSPERNNLFVDYSASIVKIVTKIACISNIHSNDTVKSVKLFNDSISPSIADPNTYIQTMSYFVKKMIKTHIPYEIMNKKKIIIECDNIENIQKYITNLLD
jgi:hypothetical protein